MKEKKPKKKSKLTTDQEKEETIKEIKIKPLRVYRDLKWAQRRLQ